MNKAANIAILFFTFPILLFSIFVGYDLPLEMLKTTGAQIPYQPIIGGALAALIFIPTFWRSTKRWYGVSLLRQKSRFVWNEPISQVRKQRALTYNLLEALVLLALCFGIYKIYNQGWPIYLAYGIAFLDSMVYTLAGAKGNNWRIGITKKAVVLADREVKVVYFTGLRKIEKAQDTLYFNYIKDLQMDMPIVAAENQKEFLEQLMQYIDHNKVYVDQSVKKILQYID